MSKAVDRGLVIGELLLLEKSGGASGDYHQPQAPREISS
jgi:molybdenum cofactor biosynthesis enzyme